ncbi:MAG TPA: MoaD family protein [Anaerolineales bacterium]|nr:MoaD family protein [Anaerolineales bacterium]
MQITVRGYLTLKELVGKRQVLLPAGSTLGDLLGSLQVDLEGSYKETAHAGGAAPFEHLVTLLNGRHVTHLLGGMDTVLQEGDEVSIFPPIAGGEAGSGVNTSCKKTFKD